MKRFYEEKESEFNKKEIQILIYKLSSLITILNVFCTQRAHEEDFDHILIMLKYINKIADKLYCKLNAWEVYEEVVINNSH